MQFAFGRFKAEHAAQWAGKTVDLTTHDGDKTGDDAAEYRRLVFTYERGRAFAWLCPPGSDEPQAVVFLEQVADIDEAAA
ncbi:hypothetical protein F5972_08505 [Microbispora cellulosiformans]|uniref:Uncharacterized protein n=1 Tax=Microbispora cellulosiformans TaxID=2614688 RepID=A0A5J5K8E1_9ACTN|nr:hypothetical protein [Microbispora cellulosiformans]KAA9379683.1 hypothetical protein F5972_08505 [Microbispora cellulosiformans]